MGNRPVHSSQTGQIKASDISRPPLGVGDSTDQTSQGNLRKLSFTNTLYQLAYSLVLLQHLNISRLVLCTLVKHVRSHDRDIPRP